MAEVDAQKCFDVALDLVKQAGKVVREAIKKKKNIETKSSAVDLVTESDKAVEKMLISGLSEAFPDHKFIGEESVSAGEKCVLTDEPTWIIDPIDGTMNFVHSFPYTCISVGLWVKKEALVGVVYNPVLEQMFTAIKGQGAFLNGEKLSVSGEKDLGQALVFSEMGTSRDQEKVNTVLTNITNLMPKVHGIRGIGSAALGISNVAAGWGDVFYHFGLCCWDMAAGTLLLTEAGGYVCDTEGGPFDIMRRRVLCASSQELAEKISKLLKQYQPERDGVSK
ncbi:inositol monophosphatase 1-like isoform X2 [Penaeus japonicus]|uniref:inositol monophosphatase 1-like isoform X2 n=1 Tax=Penaeus japonicus TaxID=27405 RepID=UPI001C70D96F|nr:inositol monophosphatase 1-like isoform X2 [Penaeus japonicus]